MTNKILLDTLEALGCVILTDKFDFLSSSSKYSIKTLNESNVIDIYMDKDGDITGIENRNVMYTREADKKKAPRN